MDINENNITKLIVVIIVVTAIGLNLIPQYVTGSYWSLYDEYILLWNNLLYTIFLWVIGFIGLYELIKLNDNLNTIKKVITQKNEKEIKKYYISDKNE